MVVKITPQLLSWLKVKWRNIFTYPKVRYSAAPRENGNTEVIIEGIVCKLCAMRARQAIAGLEEVKQAKVDFERQTVRVSLAEGASLDDFLARARDAVDQVVVARPARRALHKLRETILKIKGKDNR